MRTLACRAYWTALQGSPGAVHLNFPLREPLVSEDELPQDTSGRRDGGPYVVRRAPSRPGWAGEDASDARLSELVAGARRGVLVAGRHERDTDLGRAAAKFAVAAGWPLLADPLSRARRGDAAIAHYDALLRDAGFAASQRPDLVLRVGDLPVSKPLRGWLAGLDGVRQAVLDPEGAWQDPDSVLADSLALEPASALTRLRAWLASDDGARTRADADWLASWRGADERAAEAIVGVLGGELSEPALAAELGVLLPAQATLFVASSMPVRDIETFWPVRDDPPRVLCNRGANGIDGTVSSAFGASAHGPGPVVLMIGDVALAYDIGGLLSHTRLGLKLTIVLLDNGGGGIFDFLPVSAASMARAPAAEPGRPQSGEASTPALDESEDIYTHHIATPTGLDFAAAAVLYGLHYEAVATTPELRAALERALTPEMGSTIVHARSERAHNVELHRRVWGAVSAAISPST
jgi:2-succinyl-5-enolpyruvyl-6-hydroxy-3-cyclohexene-1-carboxylate synthase